MALRLDFHCDHCSQELGESDDIVCMTCFEQLDEKKDELKQQIVKLTEEVDEMDQKISDLQDVIQENK